MEIPGKAFIVTGAASGLGAAVAGGLVAAGGSVVLADLQEDAGNTLASKLGLKARFVRCDVTDAASAEGALAEAVSVFGGLHGLVNCAGIAPAEKVVGRDGPHRLASFQQVINVNLVGTFNMIRLAAAAMVQGEPDAGGERGVIVNTASIAAFEGQVGQAAYAASKGGIVALTLPVARELARSGIRVVTIAPGTMETPMMTAMPPEVQASLAATVPFPQRLGRPAEFAALVRHIVENAYINGEVIRLDGALRMGGK